MRTSRMDGALGGTRAIASIRLPQLNRVAFRIVEASETTIRVGLRVDRDLDSGGTEVRNHRIEVTDPEVHHPHPTTVPKVWSVDGEWCEDGRSCFLLRGTVVVIGRRERHAEVISIPPPE